MFIQTEATPNPSTLKFLPGCTVMEQGTANFTGADTAGKSPLAQRLFALDGVTGVFLGNDFVTVTKAEDKDWEGMKPLILGAVMDHFTSGAAVIEEGGEDGHSAGDDDETTTQIKELL
ncbi:MAG: NifU N-terminal domain-containing protein, partial [Rhodospirillales bacterium]|nr:NifU N-terminal domain-containing protein [Rhodospirillales bacterium]